MKIRNITYNNCSCAYYAHHEWTIETTSKDEKEVLDYCRQYMAKKARSHEEYLYAKEKADRKKMEAMMVIDGDGYVPDFLCPKSEGYGDYIIMDIDSNGFIKNWDMNKVYKFLDEQKD